MGEKIGSPLAQHFTPEKPQASSNGNGFKPKCGECPSGYYDPQPLSIGGREYGYCRFNLAVGVRTPESTCVNPFKPGAGNTHIRALIDF